MSEVDLDLEAIKARAEAATPGPWEADGEPFLPQNWRPKLSVWANVGDEFSHLVAAVATPDKYLGLTDADFIAHARTDVPALVAALEERDAEVERLREENERLKKFNEDLKNQLGAASGW